MLIRYKRPKTQSPSEASSAAREKQPYVRTRTARIGLIALAVAISASSAYASQAGDDAFRHVLHVGMTRADIERAAGWYGGCVSGTACYVGEQVSRDVLQVLFLDSQWAHACSVNSFYKIYVLHLDPSGHLHSWTSRTGFAIADFIAGRSCYPQRSIRSRSSARTIEMIRKQATPIPMATPSERPPF